MRFRGSRYVHENTRTPDPLLKSYAMQNSTCRFWGRLGGSASFISPVNWTEVGLKLYHGQSLGLPIQS
jgi:hypothetical protein